MSNAQSGAARTRVVVTRRLPEPLLARLRESATAWINPDDRGLPAENLPSSPATRKMLSAAALEKLPPDAVVVNIARGDLVDDAALIAALRRGRIAAAGLDVFDGEPAINPDYLTLPNVFLQPHQGSSTLGTRLRMGNLLLDSVERVLAGEEVANRLV